MSECKGVSERGGRSESIIAATTFPASRSQHYKTFYDRNLRQGAAVLHLRPSQALVRHTS
jgi:hypothetical protein